MPQQLISPEVAKEIGEMFPGKYVCVIVCDEESGEMDISGKLTKPHHVPLTSLFAELAERVMSHFHAEKNPARNPDRN